MPAFVPWTATGPDWLKTAKGIQDFRNSQQIAQERAQQAQILQSEADRKARASQLDDTAAGLALRGQILSGVKTPEEYEAARAEAMRLNLPTIGLPEVQRSQESEAWKTFQNKPVQRNALPSWLPEYFQPQTMPEPQLRPMPTGPMQREAVSLDMGAVERASEMGLPLLSQKKMRDQDIRSQIALDNLARNREKDTLSREWMAFQREAKIQGMTDAETQREFQRQMQQAGLGIDYARLDMSRQELAAKQEQAKIDASKAPKFTGDQSNSAIYGRRIEQGISDLDQLEAKGYDPTTPANAAMIFALVTGTPGAKLVAGPEARQTAQAYRNIATAILRKESGAAIGRDEFTTAQQQYFPGVNDDPTTLAQKRRNLQLAIAGMKTGAGDAWDLTKPSAPKPKQADAPPASALKEGVGTKFQNGQVWTLKNGQPMRVK